MLKSMFLNITILLAYSKATYQSHIRQSTPNYVHGIVDDISTKSSSIWYLLNKLNVLAPQTTVAWLINKQYTLTNHPAVHSPMFPFSLSPPPPGVSSCILKTSQCSLIIGQYGVLGCGQPVWTRTSTQSGIGLNLIPIS